MGRGGAAAAGMVRVFMTVSIIRRGRVIICKHLRCGSRASRHGVSGLPPFPQKETERMGHPAPNNISTERVIIPSGAKQAAEKPLIQVNMRENRPSVAKATADSNGFTRGLKPPSPSELSFSAACKVVPFQNINLIRDSPGCSSSNKSSRSKSPTGDADHCPASA